MFDHHHGIAGIDETVQHLQQLLNVIEVQSRRRLVENVKRLPRAAPAKFAGQLDALRLAARQGRGGLAELDVVESHVVQRLQHRLNARDIAEQFQPFLHVHLQHFMDALALEANLQRLAVEATALAHRTGHPHISQEIHLQPVGAVAFAGLAATARLVEAEPPRLVAADFRLGHLGEQCPNLIEHLDVGGRVATAASGRSATGRCR